MSDAISSAEVSHARAPTLSLDAMIIGTGVAGLYEVYLLRQQGLSVMAFDTASDVGGTWYWNRYPGARFDSEAYIYQYLFSEELYKGWSWSEKFPGQPEIERWMHYVVDRLDLRKDMRFDTTVTTARFDESTGRWRVETDRGDVIDTRYLITCCGMLSAPLTSAFPGQNSFEGTLFHTARWPKTPVDFSGKRVGVIGIGATGIQVIQTIADKVGHLTVFARTPQYTLPMKNPTYGGAEQAAYKARFQELAGRIPHTFSGFEYDFENGAWADRTPEERHAIIDEIWRDGSLKLWLASFAEIFSDEEASETVSEFVRAKMRERLKDPRLCDILIPTDYGFGTHRVPLERGFLDVFHRPNVTLVGLRETAISAITPKGIRLADGTEHALDVIILATGFDAGSGALTRIDIRGRDNRSLKEEWGQDIRTTMGLQVHGYPNLFMTGAPLAPSAALCNMTTCLQQQVEWISDCIDYMRSKDVHVIEATKAAQDEWVEHHDALAEATLVTKTNSWYMGSNVAGKPRRLLSYIGGVGTYRQKCTAVAERGYPGFTFR
ncbi:NAD(P)/FAD-dependent oxidoreductase [Methylobacterium organophilum]|uniref:flavin-containing monooxygenase n=1 Tax=Methylobacterium organophilum TaxID=410 RepID=UPI001F12CA28|nr:NAD(P)/FAD-dependent oxidoreductase [Methylobacterium organophilum]UMY16500.1 NAD(P)/FAD-dependent oxidoreductase [Methylobacterium organophilum]